MNRSADKSYYRYGAALAFVGAATVAMGITGASSLASAAEDSTLDPTRDDATQLGCSGQNSCVQSGYCSNLCGTCGIASQTAGDCQQYGAGYVRCTCNIVGSHKKKPIQ